MFRKHSRADWASVPPRALVTLAGFMVIALVACQRDVARPAPSTNTVAASSAERVTMTMTTTIATDTSMLIEPPHSMTAARNTPESVAPSQEASGATGSTGSAADAGPVTESAASGSDVQEVTVTLTDYHIDIPSVVRPGRIRFRIFNRGHTTHSLKLEGNGIEKKLWITMKPGQNATLNAELPVGSYSVYCPVDHHDRKGMRVTLKVST